MKEVGESKCLFLLPVNPTTELIKSTSQRAIHFNLSARQTWKRGATSEQLSSNGGKLAAAADPFHCVCLGQFIILTKKHN